MNDFEAIIAKLPKPYYQDESVIIINDDCRNVLPLLNDHSIDLVLTDPPYNVKKNYGNNVDDDMPLGEYIDFNKSWFGQVQQIPCIVLTTN